MFYDSAAASLIFSNAYSKRYSSLLLPYTFRLKFTVFLHHSVSNTPPCDTSCSIFRAIIVRHTRAFIPRQFHENARKNFILFLHQTPHMDNVPYTSAAHLSRQIPRTIYERTTALTILLHSYQLPSVLGIISSLQFSRLYFFS